MKKRIVMAALAATMLIGMNASQAFASDDNIPYSFKIKANYANTYSDKEYKTDYKHTKISGKSI